MESGGRRLMVVSLHVTEEKDEKQKTREHDVPSERTECKCAKLKEHFSFYGTQHAADPSDMQVLDRLFSILHVGLLKS